VVGSSKDERLGSERATNFLIALGIVIRVGISGDEK
jgi:hypothetical protein